MKPPGEASMSDRTTRIILAAIATGLWANAVGTWFRPAPAVAQHYVIRSMDNHLASIDNDIGRIQRGTCTNSRLC
jgi:hypothetical protein